MCIIILYIKPKVCLYFIQIYISEPISTRLCTHLSLGLEETVGYVWTQNFWLFVLFSSSLLRVGADYKTEDGCRSKLSATALYPWL